MEKLKALWSSVDSQVRQSPWQFITFSAFMSALSVMIGLSYFSSLLKLEDLSAKTVWALPFAGILISLFALMTQVELAKTQSTLMQKQIQQIEQNINNDKKDIYWKLNILSSELLSHSLYFKSSEIEKAIPLLKMQTFYEQNMDVLKHIDIQASLEIQIYYPQMLIFREKIASTPSESWTQYNHAELEFFGLWANICYHELLRASYRNLYPTEPEILQPFDNLINTLNLELKDERKALKELRELSKPQKK